MKIQNIILAAAAGLVLTSCGLYKKYDSQATVPDDVFGSTVGSLRSTDDGSAITSSSSLAELSWREFFTDPVLQDLIEQALANNTDLNSARIAVEQSEASLRAARLAYLPSLAFAPSGTLSSWNPYSTWSAIRMESRGWTCLSQAGPAGTRSSIAASMNVNIFICG